MSFQFLDQYGERAIYTFDVVVIFCSIFERYAKAYATLNQVVETIIEFKIIRHVDFCMYFQDVMKYEILIYM